MKIFNLSGTLLFESLHKTIRETVEQAVLRGANLQGAYLQGANLQGADLQGADLQGANLQGANLRGANLQGAYLQGANLQGADLWGADLQGAKYSILSALRAYWDHLSDNLTLELMRWDAIACGETAMTNWANGGNYPFTDSEREFYFHEKKELWKPGNPTMTYKELFVALCKEHNIKIS